MTEAEENNHRNAAVSLIRFVCKALVQEPKLWEFILDCATVQAATFNTRIAVDALEVLREAFSRECPTTHMQVTATVLSIWARRMDLDPESIVESEQLVYQALLTALHDRDVTC